LATDGAALKKFSFSLRLKDGSDDADVTSSG